MRKFWIFAVLMAAPAVAFSDVVEDWKVYEKSSQCHMDLHSGVAQLRLSAGRDGQINLRMLGKGWKYVPDTLPYRATWYRFGTASADQEWEDLFLAEPIAEEGMVGVRNPMWESWSSQMTSAQTLTLKIEGVTSDVTFDLAGVDKGLSKLLACATKLTS